MLNSFVQGFLVSLSLIVAIGAQNAFVLKQGLKRQYVFWICVVCAISDSILISVGILGFSKVVTTHAHWVEWSKYLGALFLFIYGAQHFYQAYTSKQGLEDSSLSEVTFLNILGLCLALTWLNPHVYLDTVVLIGAISTNFAHTKLYFTLGAVCASWLFFFSLGYGARLLRPVFQDYRAWKVLDVMIGFVMWGIAWSLVV